MAVIADAGNLNAGGPNPYSWYQHEAKMGNELMRSLSERRKLENDEVSMATFS